MSVQDHRQFVVQQEESVADGETQRVAAIRIISQIAFVVTVGYSLVYGWLGWDRLALFTAVFTVWYGLIIVLCLRGATRLAGVALIGGGFGQLGGTNMLFVPADLGNQVFIILLPIFALIVIHRRDRAWFAIYTVVALGLLMWFEYGRGTIAPPYVVPIGPEQYGPMRAMSVAVTVLMMVGVFRSFHNDLNLARKRLRVAHERSESLLLNILPPSIAERLKEQPETIADDFSDASVLFADVVGFTTLASEQTASETVRMLNSIFSAFDASVDAHGLEKIKTIGDAYMVASGVPTPSDDHAARLLAFALDMFELLRVHNETTGQELQLRIGVNSGPVTAGVIGSRKFTYDLWGDTVNVASRMESSGVAGRVQVSQAVAEAVSDAFLFEDRGSIEIKGKGKMRTFLLVSAKSDD